MTASATSTPSFWLAFPRQTQPRLLLIQLQTLLISTAGRSIVCSLGRIKCVKWIKVSFFFCMGKNILLSEFSVAVFDLWDIYTSNTSIFQQPLFLVGVGLLSTCQTLKEKRQICSDHHSSLQMPVLPNSLSKVGIHMVLRKGNYSSWQAFQLL